MSTVEIRYLYNEAVADKCFGLEGTGLNPVTSEFSVSCYYFEVDEAMNKK